MIILICEVKSLPRRWTCVVNISFLRCDMNRREINSIYLIKKWITDCAYITAVRYELWSLYSRIKKIDLESLHIYRKYRMKIAGRWLTKIGWNPLFRHKVYEFALCTFASFPRNALPIIHSLPIMPTLLLYTSLDSRISLCSPHTSA